MMSVKIRQFIFSFLAIASLFASSVSACTCSHHQETAETESPSCHEHSNRTKAENHNEADSNETNISEADCICLQSAPKIVAKSNSVQIEKHLSAFTIEKPLEILIVSRIFPVNFNFAKPLYLSDSFYNLSPGRAPPVL